MKKKASPKAGQLQTQHFSFLGFSSFLDSYRQFDSHPTPQCSYVSQSEFGGGGCTMVVGGITLLLLG
jgi:hypothetical protein